MVGSAVPHAGGVLDAGTVSSSAYQQAERQGHESALRRRRRHPALDEPGHSRSASASQASPPEPPGRKQSREVLDEARRL